MILILKFMKKKFLAISGLIGAGRSEMVKSIWTALKKPVALLISWKAHKN